MVTKINLAEKFGRFAAVAFTIMVLLENSHF